MTVPATLPFALALIWTLGVASLPAQDADAAKKILEQHMRLGSANLSRAVALIAAADVDLRGGKEWDDTLVLEVLVARLARLAGSGRTTKRRVAAR